MNSIDIKGYKRSVSGKRNSKQLRLEAKTPCVMYGGAKIVHFYIPMAYLKDIVHTPNVYFINLDIEGKKYKVILQDIQFHPVSEVVIHMDFLETFEDREVKIMVPIYFEGNSPGIMQGGLLVKNIRKLLIKGLPKNIPDKIPVDISKLDLNMTVKIRDIVTKDYEILMPKPIPVAGVIVPRALRSKQTSETGEATTTVTNTNE